MPTKPLVISAPDPRSLELIFGPVAREALEQGYDVREADPDAIAALPDEVLAACRYVIGQPPLPVVA